MCGKDCKKILIPLFEMAGGRNRHLERQLQPLQPFQIAVGPQVGVVKGPSI
jgi:hypothetical protein